MLVPPDPLGQLMKVLNRQTFPTAFAVGYHSNPGPWQFMCDVVFKYDVVRFYVAIVASTISSRRQ